LTTKNGKLYFISNNNKYTRTLTVAIITGVNAGSREKCMHARNNNYHTGIHIYILIVLGVTREAYTSTL